MPVLKAHCPECDALIRQSIDAIDEPTGFTLTCPKCKNEFVATAEPPERTIRKPSKKTRRRDDDDEGENPRRRPAGKSNNALIVAGIVAGVLLIGGGIFAVVAFSASKDKNKDIAKVDAS